MGAVNGLCAQDAREIVRKSVETDQISWQRAKDYAWVRRVETHVHGGKAKDYSRTFESIVLYGRPYSRLVARDDKPLSADEQKKQQERLEKISAERAHESPAHKAQRERARERQRAFTREIPDIYDFKLEGQDVVDGHEVWVISAVPKRGYKPRDRDAWPLQKFRGKLWIDKSEYQWIRPVVLRRRRTGSSSSCRKRVSLLPPSRRMAAKNAKAKAEGPQGRRSTSHLCPVQPANSHQRR